MRSILVKKSSPVPQDVPPPFQPRTEVPARGRAFAGEFPLTPPFARRVDHHSMAWQDVAVAAEAMWDEVMGTMGKAVGVVGCCLDTKSRDLMVD